MAAPNFFYTDIAAAQIQGRNFPGSPGSVQIGQPPYNQNRSILEGPPEISATYLWVGTEAQYDIINIAILPAGTMVPGGPGRVCSGATAPAATLTFAIGDDDMGLLSELPIVNYAGAVPGVGGPNTLQAPVWVTGTSYVAGNVVLDDTSSPTYRSYTCIAAVSGSTAPHSDSTHWVPNYSRYSGSINCAGAAGNVLFASGYQLAGLPPYAPTIGTLPTGYSATQLAAQPYIIRNDCWLQALILTMSTPVANTISTFRVPLVAVN